MSQTAFSRGYISVYNKHTHYAVMWNSETISVYYGGKVLFSLPETQWEILNAKGESPRPSGDKSDAASGPNMVKLGFVKHGQPVLVFYGRHRKSNILELVYYDILEATWEAFSIPNIICLEMIQVSG